MQLTDIVSADRVALADDAGCTPWLGERGPDGYGRVGVGTRRWLAHRLAYTLAHGPIPDGVEIDHACHNRACVNPDHLRPATRQQNAQNMCGARADSRTGQRGVRQLPSGRFQAYIIVDGKWQTLGTYHDRRVAQRVADQERRERFGEFAGVLT